MHVPRLKPHKLGIFIRLVERVYGPELVAELKPAAARGLMLHLDKMQKDDRVIHDGEEWREKGFGGSDGKRQGKM